MRLLTVHGGGHCVVVDGDREINEQRFICTGEDLSRLCKVMGLTPV